MGKAKMIGMMKPYVSNARRDRMFLKVQRYPARGNGKTDRGTGRTAKEFRCYRLKEAKAC